MTLFYPDISGYEAGISLAGMAAVVVKATEGTTYTNPDFARVRQDASSRGIPWAAYHFLRHGSSPAAQAQHFRAVAGSAPCMLDVETATDGSKATVQDALAFAQALAALGGRVTLVYLPHWYWQALGSPDLRPLAAAGMGLVSSYYPSRGYGDNGPGWAAYGGVTPVVWQYTSSAQLNGFTVDMNAYRGTVDEFRALLDGGTDMALTDMVPQTGTPGHDLGTCVSDLWNQEMNEHSGFVPTDRSARTQRLMRIEDNTAKILAGQAAPQPVTVDAAAVAKAIIGDPGFAALLASLVPTADQTAEAVVEKLAARLQS